jgi:hypothetical protein
MQESGLNCELWDVCFLNEHEGWIAGGGIGNPGVVLHTISGGEGAEGIDPEYVKSVNSLDQNHPNPVVNATRISYHIHHPERITVSLYDVLGNKLETLVDEYQPKGDYTIDFKSDPYPEGIYFYDLKVSSGLVKTVKMVIVK